MKVLLIYPPRHHIITSGLPKLVEEDVGTYPPLGLLYLAAHLRRFSDHEVSVLDCQVENLAYEAVEAEVRRRSPDLVGITVLTLMLYDAVETARRVKSVSREIHVTLGGPHTSIYPRETALLEPVDSVVIGEGERVFTDLVEAVARRRELSTVKGIAYRREGEVVMTPPADPITDLDTLPPIDRTMLPLKKYRSLVDVGKLSTTMISSRGCPGRCIFCDVPYKVFRPRSPGLVVDEMEECVRLGIGEVYFYDDAFNLRKDRVLELCRTIAERKLPVRWAFRGRVTPFDEEMAAALREAGCVRIQFGVESGSEDILRTMRKAIDLGDVRRAFRIAHQFGIATVAYFMIAFPGETREHVLRTIEFAKEIAPDYPVFCVTVPFPGTELYRLGLERGVLSHDFWLDHATRPTPALEPELWTEHLTVEEIRDLLRKAYRRFYFRPSYIAREFAKIRSVRELLRKASGSLRMARDSFL